MHADDSDDDVFRDRIEATRDGYSVSYQPADSRYPFAILQLGFLSESLNLEEVGRKVESEFDNWIARFRVPIFASAFDLTDSVINLDPARSGATLMGYAREDGSIFRTWSLLKDEELPSSQRDPEYLKNVYTEIPFRVRGAVKRKVMEDAIRQRRTVRMILFLMVGVPVLIELLSLGVNWLGYLLSAVSILTGLYKALKAFGYVKPTAGELAEQEKERKMSHYFYHCEQNPSAFSQLRAANFKRETIARNLKEAALNGARRNARN